MYRNRSSKNIKLLLILFFRLYSNNMEAERKCSFSFQCEGDNQWTIRRRNMKCCMGYIINMRKFNFDGIRIFLITN